MATETTGAPVTAKAGHGGTPTELAAPHIRLLGEVNSAMFNVFADALAAQRGAEGPLVLELTTGGGDADMAGRIATDIRLFREQTGRPTLFLGKANVYSAGITIMTAFPCKDRWLARGAVLLVRGRSIARTLELNGPLAGERVKAQMILAEIDAGLKAQEDVFKALAADCRLSLQELKDRARKDWYVDAEEALERGLIGGGVV